MKFTLLFFLAITLSFSDSRYQQIQIDMHGGEYDSNYQGNYNSFSSNNFGMFIDKNSTKESK